MKKLIVSAIFWFLFNLSHAQEADPNIALIQKEFDAYLEDFVERDTVSIAKYFQYPSIFKAVTPNIIFNTEKDATDGYDSLPLQEGYAYSTSENLQIAHLAGPIYYLKFDYSRYNDAVELLYEGHSVYFYSNETGNWKIFSLWTGDRE